jgi:glycosyltransferase involved in cell wall biosynthesis
MYDYYLAHALVALGHRVTVLAARWSPDVPAYEDDSGVAVRRVYFSPPERLNRVPLLRRYARPLLQVLYSRQVARTLNRMADDDSPDVVEFAEINAEGWAYLRQSQRRPVVVRCHTPTFVLRDYYTLAEMPFDTAWTTRLEQDCIRRADALTAPSHDMARTVAGRMGFPVERFTVIPNPLDVQAFAVEQGEKSAGDEIIVLHVGRLDRTKGIEVLAQAIPAVVRTHPNVRFVYVGADRPTGQGDTWQQRLTGYFAQAGVEQHVTFTGPVDQATLLDWYRRADIAIVPSLLYESFSYTVAQAMAGGLAVIATRIGGIPETLGEAGLIVEPSQAGSLTQALNTLIINVDLRARLAATARQRVLDYHAPIVAERTLQFYSLLRGR